jgi:SPX domain protein involved in polyphosphate accumulation
MIRRFNRFELKYVLPLSHCGGIIDELEERIRPDRHGGREGYPIVSLYYDSPDFECFWSKIEGLRYRRKVRLRVYPDASGVAAIASGSVEIKQRINRTVQKRRLELPIEQAEALCEGQLASDARAGLDALDAQVAEEVTFLAESLDLRPAAITAYHRRAFEGELDNAGLRVTFDSMVGARVHALNVRAPAPNHLILPQDWCIMEVKANEAVPDWVTSMLARHDCQLQRVSKYCAGVAQLMNLDVLPLAQSPNIPLAPRAAPAADELGSSPPASSPSPSDSVHG